MIGASNELAVENPAEWQLAEEWSAQLATALAAVGGLSLHIPNPLKTHLARDTRRTFTFGYDIARDPRFHLCRFYGPDLIDDGFPYGEGMPLQLRSGVSHLNEVWAVETGGAILYSLGDELGWEFIFDAACWTYDESRHARMGYDRLRQWGYELYELPLGNFITTSLRDELPIYWLGMLSYFETKNIGKKNQRARTFAAYHDRVSQHDMEFDWADETIHAHYGTHWLSALHTKHPGSVPVADAVRTRCAELIAATIRTATNTERADIRAVANAMLAKAEQLAQSIGLA